MSNKDPRKIHPEPPYSEKKQSPPGSEAEMAPKADHGESSYKGAGLLEGRHALITGADSGIGRAVALAFAREGADVAISYLSEERDARETERLVTEAGRKAILLPGDIGDRTICENVAQKAVDAFGAIDLLVNNAAFQRTHDDFGDIPDDEFEETYRVNVFAMFRLCKAILPQMKDGGSIINTASIQSFDPSPNLLAYASSKAAIVSFTRSFASLAIKQGVRVNAVAPGPVWTPLIPSTMPKEKVKQFGAQTAFKRAAQPAEIAPIFVFLASDKATYVTGEVYGATGGQMPILSTNQQHQENQNNGFTRRTLPRGSVGTCYRASDSEVAPDIFLWAALASIATSLVFQMMDRKQNALFVGQWAPTFLLLGIYNKLVKQFGSDRGENES